MKTVSLETYNALKAKLAEFESWRNGRQSYKVDEIPLHVPQVSNDERSQIEVYEFVHNPPDKYFCYIKHEPNSRNFYATTWTGDVLGQGILGYQYQCPAFGGWGSKRRSVRFKAINGKEYHGTYFESSGSYARIKEVKGRK